MKNIKQFIKMTLILYVIIFVSSFLAAVLQAIVENSIDRFVNYKLPTTLYSFVFGLIYSGWFIMIVVVCYHYMKRKIDFSEQRNAYVFGLVVSLTISLIFILFDHSSPSYVAFTIFLGIILGPILNYLDEHYLVKQL